MFDSQREISTTEQISKIGFALVCALLVVAASLLHITDPIEKNISDALKPIVLTVDKIILGIKNEFSIIQEARILSSKYKATLEQNILLRSEVAQLTLIQEENKKLREQLGSPELQKYKLIPAQIITRDRELTVTYDKTNAVTKGSIAVFKNNFIGVVKIADEKSALVTPAADPILKMNIIIISSDKKIIPGVMQGQFGTSISVDQVDQDAKIEKGNTVLLARSKNIPDGIVVGEISEIEKQESQLFQKAIVKSLVEVDTIGTVFFIQ